MVDFIEVKSTQTFETVFQDPTSGEPIDVNDPKIDIGFYESGVFVYTLANSPLIKVPGRLGEYVKQVYLDDSDYVPDKFYYVRYKGNHPTTGNLILQEGSFRTLASSEEKKTQVFMFGNVPPSAACVISPEFYISANSEATGRRAFLRSEFLGSCDLWIEIIDSQTNEPKNVYSVTFDIEDLTDCTRICESECGGILMADTYVAVNFETGKYYADWQVDGDANPGPYMIHWDIQYTSTSQITRVSYNFHVVAKKNAYDLNFQEPYAPWSPTADN